MGDIGVTQADRDAAATLIEGRAWLISSSQPDWCAIDQKMFREGAKDDHPFVQAFARHRQAAEKATRERDAGIADSRRRILSEQFKAAKERKARTEARDFESMAIEAVHIATAIRSQGHE